MTLTKLVLMLVCLISVTLEPKEAPKVLPEDGKAFGVSGAPAAPAR